MKKRHGSPLKLEALEPRTLLSATLLGPIADAVADMNGPNTVLDLSANFDDPARAGTIVQFDTVLGDFDVELFANDAPATVANFLNYVYDGDYSDSLVHRSVTDFVVQGGGFTYPGWADVPTDAPVVNEPGISNTYGTLAMAKLDGDPDSATSQWFVNVADNSADLDAQNGGFTVFGEVQGTGMDVVEAIADVPVYDFGSPWEALPLMDYDGQTITDDNVVLINAITPELTYTIANDNPTLVTAVVWGNSLTLQYAADQTGTANITVTAHDLDGGTVADTFAIEVLDRPTANDDRAETHQGVAVAIDVVANDTQGEHPLDATTVSVVGAPANGTTTVDPVTGAITYTPDAGTAGTDTFTYTIDDDQGTASDPATVYVTVSQDPVVLAALADLEIDADAADTVLDLSTHFDDLDFDGTLVRIDTVLGSFDIELFPNDAPATVTNFLSYVYNGDYHESIIHHSEPGTLIQGGGHWYPGWYDITADDPVANEPGLSNTLGTLAMAKDDGADPDSATSEWFINLADNSDPFDTTNGGATVFGQVLYNGMDVVNAIAAVPTYDFGGAPWDALPLIDYDEVTITDDNVVLVNSVATELTYTVTSDNTDAVTATVWGDTLTLNCTPGQWGTANITVRATDLNGDYVEDTFTVTATGAPLPTDDTASTHQEQAIVIDVLANDSARGIAIDPTTVAIVTAPTNGVTTVDPATGAITYTPAPAFHGTDEFTYTVADIDGGVSVEGTVSLDINATPTIVTPFDDLLLGISPAATDIDLTGRFDDPDVAGTVVEFDTVLGDIYAALYDIDTPATVANFLNYVGDGDYDNSIIHRSVADFVVQGGGFTYPTWDDVPTDDPVVNEPGISNTRGTIAMAKVADDPDSATSGWFFNIADNSGNLDDQNGGFTVFGTVLGDGMDVVDAIAALDVYEFDAPFDSMPLIDYDGVNVYEENVVLVNTISVVDEVAYTATSSNEGLVTTTVAADGTLTLDVTPGAWGTATITVQATDRDGGAAEQTFTVTVQGTPLAAADTDDVAQNGAVVVDVLANDTARGVAINPASVIVTTAPANGTVDIDPATGAITYTPNANYTGIDTFAYTVDNTLGETSDPASVDIEAIGVPIAFGDGIASSLAYTDADGTEVTVSLRGGTALIAFNGYVTASNNDGRSVTVTGTDLSISRIELADTTDRTSLSFRTSRGTIDGATVGTITGDDPAGRLSGRGIDLNYGGIVMTGDGYFNTVDLHNVTNGADIIMPGDGATRGLRLTFANIADPGTDMILGSPVSSLTAQRWVGSSLVAPWVGRITVRGDSRNGIEGDLGIDMTLSGIGATRDVLGGVSVSGQLVSGTWDITGNASAIRAGSTGADWTLNTTGTVKGINLTGQLAGALTADSFGSIRTRGDLAATITATGTDNRGSSIKGLQGGSAANTTLVAAGGIGSVRVTEWTGGSITAGSLSSLTTSGDRRNEIDGNFEANLTLTGEGATRDTLGRATIAGDLENCVWDVTGNVGSVSQRTGEVNDWYLVVHSDVKTLTLGTVNLAALNIDGTIGRLTAQYWSGGSILADSMGSLRVTGDRRAQLPGDFTAAVTLTGEGLDDRTPTLKDVSVTNGLGVAYWDITGDIGRITAGFLQDWNLNVHSSIGSIRVGAVTNTNMTVDGSIGRIQATSWEAGSITADYITGLATRSDTRNGIWGNFTADLTLSGEGATRGSLGRTTIDGWVYNCTWDITGDIAGFSAIGVQEATITVHNDVDSLDLGSVNDGTLVVEGGIDTLDIITWNGGSITANWLDTLDVAGDRRSGTWGHFSADITLSGEGATGNTLGSAEMTGTLYDSTWLISGTTGTIAADAWMTNSTIRTDNDIERVTFGGMDTANVFAGVDDAITALPDPTADFTAACTIGSFTISGLEGVAFSTINSNIAAATLGSVSITDVQTNNSDVEFGVAANNIGTLTWRQDRDSYRWPDRWAWAGFTLDFVVREA